MKAPKPSGFSNTKAGKLAILERTKKLVDKSAIIITIPIDGVTKEQTDLLRKALPKPTKASVVKNAIFKKAIDGTQFSVLQNGLRDENMYLFIPEGESKATFEAYKKWQKEVKRTEPKFSAKAGALEGILYTGDNIDVVVNLPTKLELITKIAQGIKAVPLKVAKGVKAVPDKLGRAFAAIRDQLEEKSKPAEAETSEATA
eukprot:gene21708-28092_t